MTQSPFTCITSAAVVSSRTSEVECDPSRTSRPFSLAENWMTGKDVSVQKGVGPPKGLLATGEHLSADAQTSGQSK